jgi:L-alanine-DL-glutamate epimerase-like enolase superfamily enzyme
VRITKVSCRVVQIARCKAYGRVAMSSLGAGDRSLHVIALIETSSGITGVGEIASCFPRRGRLLAAEVEDLLVPILVGENPLEITRLIQAMDRVLYGSEPTKSGIEMALLDIAGKDKGVPVYQLLGGKMRDAVPLSYSIPFGTPDEMAGFAADLVGKGFGTVKAKVGQGPERDLATVASIRQAIGSSTHLRIDANMAWKTAKQAISIISAMEEHNPELIEQPVAPEHLAMMAEIRRGIATPLLADESVWAPRDAADVIRHEAADAINIYVAEAGGILKARRIFEMCESFGLGCLIGSMPEMGVATAAQIHLGIAMPNLDYSSDTCGHLYHDDDIIVPTLRVENGHAFAPEAPGLGVDLDMAALERFSI